MIVCSVDMEISGVGRDPDGPISRLSFLMYKGRLYTCFFSILELVFFCFFFPSFLLLLQYCDVEHISAKKRAKRLSNAISKEREFSVSLETKKLVFLSLPKRQNDWEKNLKMTT